MIKPISDYLAITLDRNKYWLLNNEMLQTCNKLNNKNFVCKSKQPVYTQNSKVAECEVELLSHRNKLSDTCRIDMIKNTRSIYWINMDAGNSWIVHAPQEQSIDVICGDNLETILINGTIKLEIQRSCTIKYDSTIINAHEIFKNELTSSFNPMINIHDVIKEKNFTSLYNFNKNITNMELRKLDYFINQQKEQIIKTTPLETSSTDIHQFVISYMAISLVIVISIIGYIKYRINHKKKKEGADKSINMVPVAAPRLSRSMFDLPNIMQKKKNHKIKTLKNKK